MNIKVHVRENGKLEWELSKLTLGSLRFIGHFKLFCVGQNCHSMLKLVTTMEFIGKVFKDE